MASLIITIVSIALVAIAAVMGAYYGGTAFSNSSISAYAAQTIQTMNQIKAAAYLYVANNPNYGSLTTPQQWGDALTANTNNTRYLSLPYNDTYQSFNISYGSAGSLLDWAPDYRGINPISGTYYIFGGGLNLSADLTGNHLYVVWFVAPINWATAATIKFYTQLCYTINQQMGQIPYASSLTLVNNVGYTTLSIPNGGDTTGRPGGSPGNLFTGLSNICALNSVESSPPFFNEYEFAIPVY